MNITVYCGSRNGNDPAFTRAAEELGSWFCREDHALVYGGGNIGIMGILADVVLEGGGRVTGVIPEFLMEYEIGHTGLHTLEIVETMSQRKNRMIELGQAYIALPGGTGTLEEIAEVISHHKLGLHSKPCIFYDVAGFFDPMGDLFDSMVKAGFITAEDRSHIFFVERPEELDPILADPDGPR